MECEICSLLNDDNSLVFQTDNWKVFVMSEQSYLGRCVISCKRHCPSLSELTDEEWQDFKSVASKLEKSTKTAFGADLVNWTCLMNGAFKKEPYNPHVHWHFRPRYGKQVKFAGRIFEDPKFGHHYDHDSDDIVSDEVVQQIVESLRQA